MSPTLRAIWITLGAGLRRAECCVWSAHLSGLSLFTTVHTLSMEVDSFLTPTTPTAIQVPALVPALAPAPASRLDV